MQSPRAITLLFGDYGPLNSMQVVSAMLLKKVSDINE